MQEPLLKMGKKVALKAKTFSIEDVVEGKFLYQISESRKWVMNNIKMEI